MNPKGTKLSGPIEAALSALWALAHPEQPEILWSTWQTIPLATLPAAARETAGHTRVLSGSSLLVGS